MKNRATIIVMVVAIVAIVVVAGIMVNQNKSDSDKTSTTKTSPPQSNIKESDSNSDAVVTDEVEIEDFAFSPAKITVKIGMTVTWTNKDSVEHTVTTDDTSAGGPDSALLGKDESYSFTFTKAGSFDYFCKPHPHMRGVVVVTE